MYKDIMDFELQGSGITVSFHVLRIAQDYLIIVNGGDVPHIGSVTIGQANQKHSRSIGGHKEHVITENIYDTLSETCDEAICIVGGIHIENISNSQIETVQHLCEKAATRIAKKIGNSRRIISNDK